VPTPTAPRLLLFPSPAPPATLVFNVTGPVRLRIDLWPTEEAYFDSAEQAGAPKPNCVRLFHGICVLALTVLR
jgi:hypothetical protein